MIKKGVQKVTSFLANYFIYTYALLTIKITSFLTQKSTKNGSFLTSFLTKKVSFFTSFWRPNRQLSGSDLSQKGCPKSDLKRSLFGHFWHFLDPQKWPLFGGVFPLLATTLLIARDEYKGSGQRCSKRGSFWRVQKHKNLATFWSRLCRLWCTFWDLVNKSSIKNVSFQEETRSKNDLSRGTC